MAISAMLMSTFVIVFGCLVFFSQKEKKEWVIGKNVLGCFLHSITIINNQDGFFYTIAYEQSQEQTELIFGIMLEDGSIHIPSDLVERHEGLWTEKLDPMPLPALLTISAYDLLCGHFCAIEINTHTGAIRLPNQ